VRTKLAMMIALTVVLVMLVGSAGTALAQTSYRRSQSSARASPAWPQEPTRCSSSGSATGSQTG
jgi:hypothetical protein